MPKRDAPKHCYWRGGVLWARLKVAGHEYRWSLRTSHAATASRLVEAKRQELIAAAHHGEHRKTYDEALAEWSLHIIDQVGTRTAKRYGVSLKQIAGFLRPLYIDQIDRDTVGDIVRARRKAGRSTATIRRDLVALSSVLAFTEDEGWREGNPALERLHRLKERRDPIVLPEPADIERVITRAPGNFRHLIRAAWLTGCRQEELATVERRRLDHRIRQLTVIGKGNKLRVVQLSDEAFALLRSIPVNLGSKWLFWHHDGEPFANVASRFHLFVRDAAESAQKEGTDFHAFRFHDLRHRYAVDYLKGGGNIYTLQGQLGHRSVKTTEIYLDYLTPEEARRAKFGGAQNGARVQRSDDADTA